MGFFELNRSNKSIRKQFEHQYSLRFPDLGLHGKIAMQIIKAMLIRNDLIAEMISNHLKRKSDYGA
uniref:DepN n=1 Tax=Chromobacterium violaceum TaxID=536 RepID=A4ZPY0_CHRVL|nr:DepN [Chromobacterium violaceum]